MFGIQTGHLAILQEFITIARRSSLETLAGLFETDDILYLSSLVVPKGIKRLNPKSFKFSQKETFQEDIDRTLKRKTATWEVLKRCSLGTAA